MNETSEKLIDNKTRKSWSELLQRSIQVYNEPSILGEFTKKLIPLQLLLKRIKDKEIKNEFI